MRLKSCLHQINPLLSRPEVALRLLRLFALLLLAGILIGVYNFVRSTLNDSLSRRHNYMSGAIVQAQTFFTTRETLLESLSLSAVRQTAEQAQLPPATQDEIRLRQGNAGGEQWSIWLTERMREHLKHKQLNLLYISAAPQPRVERLYGAHPQAVTVPPSVLKHLVAQEPRMTRGDEGQWLTEQSAQSTQLYIFFALDPLVADSGWLGLEMDGNEVLAALSDQSAGEFMILNSQGALVLTNTPTYRLSQALLELQSDNFFGLIGGGWFPEQLVIRKQLKSTDWQLIYAFELRKLLHDLWPQLLGALLFSLLSAGLIHLLTRRVAQHFIVPALNRIQALVESEAFSRDVIQTAPVALCVLRRSDGQVVLENTLAQQWLGQGKAPGQRRDGWIRQVFDPDSSAPIDHVETAEGRHLHLSSVPTRYRGEDVLFCAFSDISTRKQVEAALDEARSLAESANEAKTLFLATMSHEIRTPLYGVLGTLELLGRTRLDQQQKHYLQAMEGSSATLLQMICGVLDVSKIEAGQLALELREFSPLDLACEIVQSYAAAAQAKGLQLYACLEWQLPERLVGDVARIRQILGNLLSNALKFTDVGRVVLRAHLVELEGNRCTIEWQVSDTGKGITEQDQMLLFEPFFQTSGNTNVVAGTGLGLPICLRLTRLMNGDMRVVSELGLGSSFSLSLPLQRAMDTAQTSFMPLLGPQIIYVRSPVRELAESLAGWLRRWGARVHLRLPGYIDAASGCVLLELHPGAIKHRLEPEWQGPLVLACAIGHHEPPRDRGWQVDISDLRAIHRAVSQAQGQPATEDETLIQSQHLPKLGLHVLVAEDNVINQLILKDQLEELGCSVKLAGNGDEALSLWHNERFDVVLTDINMPRLNGYELSRELRRLGCSTPIFGATANAMHGEEAQCLAAGMERCLVKPFSLRTLLSYLAPYAKAPPQPGPPDT
ncbi:response regulator [Pseudomonas sp. CF161]|uniref:response regulator n=1 Tax=Pseudomonas sp. CF161 TaxID=911241 RepID=UPI0005B94F97|nr:response regulator [Pseudomonas sp. CF161]